MGRLDTSPEEAGLTGSADRDPLTASALLLIGVNLIPLAGVIGWGWNAFTVILLYWMETAVIGAITILRILAAAGDLKAMGQRMIAKSKGRLSAQKIAEMESQIERMQSGGSHGLKLFMVPFFCVHFGIFMFVHLMFVFAMFGREKSSMGGSPFDALERVREVMSPIVWLSVLGLFASHLFSFFVNYLGKGEYRATTPPEEMQRPYGRVVVMHLAILFGGFITMALGSPIGVLILLIVGKTVIDLHFHRRERRKALEKIADRSGGAHA